jgi:O-antigen/teichoic acid export membrane protein
MIFTLVALVFNLGFTIAFAQTIGVIALSIGWVIGTTIQIVFLAIFFSKKLTDFNFVRFFKKIVKIAVASAVMAFSVVWIPSFIELGYLTTQILRIIVGASLFIIVAYILKCNELRFFSDIYKKLTSSRRAS